MATCKDVIRIALRYCGEGTNYSDADPQDYIDGLYQLNILVNTWYELGLQLGDTESEYTDINQAFGYPLFALDAFQRNLALQLWPLFNMEKPLPPTLYESASKSLNDLFVLAGPSVSSVFPENLPIGSGNWFVDSWNYYPSCDEPIYPNCDTNITTEKNAPIITENNNDS